MKRLEKLSCLSCDTKKTCDYNKLALIFYRMTFAELCKDRRKIICDYLEKKKYPT